MKFFRNVVCHVVEPLHMYKYCKFLVFFSNKLLGPIFSKAVYFRRGLTCTLGLTNGLIDGGQPRAKPNLRKAMPNHVLKTVFSPRLATVYQVVGYPKSPC